MAKEKERRYKVLTGKIQRYEDLIRRNKDMGFTGSITAGACFIKAMESGFLCASNCFNNGDLAQILFYGASSLLFGSTSLVQGCKIARNTIENEKLRAELKEIQSELKQLKENNMDDTMGMGR